MAADAAAGDGDGGDCDGGEGMAGGSAADEGLPSKRVGAVSGEF